MCLPTEEERMEECARKGELVDDVSDTGSHEQIERVVVSKSQHLVKAEKKLDPSWPNTLKLGLPASLSPKPLAQGSCLHISSRPLRVF